ncbi:MAG: M1 family aminopeptidase [Gemmatimonadales bacterium]
MSPRFALLLVLAAAPLSAQSNAERMANDRYSRSHDYDLVHERISLSRFNWDSTSLVGQVAVTLRALRPAFDSVVLDAGALLDIGSVRAGGVTGRPGAALAFSRVRDTLVVRLPRPVALGDTVRFTIDYVARIDNGRGLTFIEADSLPPSRPKQLWSQGEGDNNHFWFPTYDFPNDRMTWEVEATVPRGFTAVSNGRLALDRVNRDGTRTMQWRQDKPAVTYLVSLVVAPLVKLTDHWKGVPVDYYVYRPDSARARPLFRVTPDMIGVYSRLTGVPYPWAQYAQTTVADFFGGMENVSATTLVDWLPDAKAYADRPWYQHILIPHELAHQWFGDFVTTANWANMWLNEGFAEFMPGQYWAAKGGRHLEEDYYLDEYDNFLQIDAGRRMPVAALNSNNIYPRGALILLMLKQYLGEERFWAGVHRYLTDHALGVATTDDLRQAFLLATGENLDWFWDQWVYQAGYPEFVVSASWDSSLALVTLNVRQAQVDTLPADSAGLRFTVPAVFRMPLTVRVGMAGGDVVSRVDLTEREQVIHIAGVHTAPTMVAFDENNTILKSLTFDQPTGWLATQLQRDSTLWNRWWIVGQLAQRKNDTAARAALITAATGADYFLTRQQAVQALAAFPGPLARNALLKAMADTSAAVRASAVEGLAGYPEAPVIAVVQAAWREGESYSVRAAALGSLLKLEPAGAHGYLEAGLRTASYRDAIVDAALRGIAQVGDTMMLDLVSAAVETTPNAGYALAGLAARGNARALLLLRDHLASPRAAVRRRVLQAIRVVLPPAVAREQLMAGFARAPNDAARTELRAALERLGQ